MRLFRSGDITLDEVEIAKAELPSFFEGMSFVRQNGQLLLGGRFGGDRVKGRISARAGTLDLQLSIVPLLVPALEAGLIFGPIVVGALLVWSMFEFYGSTLVGFDPARVLVWFVNPASLAQLALLLVGVILVCFVGITLHTYLDQRRYLCDRLRNAVGASQILKGQALTVDCTFHTRQSGEKCCGMFAFLLSFMVFAALVSIILWSPPNPLSLMVGGFFSVLAFVPLMVGIVLIAQLSRPKIVVQEGGLVVKGKRFQWDDLTVQAATRTSRKYGTWQVLLFRSTTNDRHRTVMNLQEVHDLELLRRMLEVMVSLPHATNRTHARLE